MVRACHTPRQPLRNHPSGHLVKRRKLAWFGHDTRYDSLSETIHQGTLSRDGNLHGSGMTHATTASPKPSSTVPWTAEEMLDGQLQRVDLSANARTSHKGFLLKTGRRSLLNRPSCPPNNPIGERTELN